MLAFLTVQQHSFSIIPIVKNPHPLHLIQLWSDVFLVVAFWLSLHPLRLVYLVLVIAITPYIYRADLSDKADRIFPPPYCSPLHLCMTFFSSQ